MFPADAGSFRVAAGPGGAYRISGNGQGPDALILRKLSPHHSREVQWEMLELLERRLDWGSPRRSTTVIFLEPLAPGESRELIGSLLQQSEAATGLLDALAERSGGNPLFAETVAQRIVEEGSSSGTALPDTMQGLLAARLDALNPPQRELVAHASVGLSPTIARMVCPRLILQRVHQASMSPPTLLLETGMSGGP